MPTYAGEVVDGQRRVWVVHGTPRPSADELGEFLRSLREFGVSPSASAVGGGAQDPRRSEREAALMSWKRDLLGRIEAAERPALARPLLDLVGGLVGQFGWGPGAGGRSATRLARAILAAELGVVPSDAACAVFGREVIARLPGARFELNAAVITDWLAANRFLVEPPPVAPSPERSRREPVVAGPESRNDGADSPATASALVAACEEAWAAIGAAHPRLPDVVVVLGTGVERGRLVKLGHWWGGRWLADGKVRGEVLLAGEALHLDPGTVFEILLHEAAHGLNAARGIKDTSRGGRYHNQRFRETAEEVGLAVSEMPPYGWAKTTLTPATTERYAGAITSLGEAMRIARQLERGVEIGEVDGDRGGRDGAQRGNADDGRSKSTAGPAVCGCGRKLRMAPSVLAAGPVVCGLCGGEFIVGREVERTWPAGGMVDRTFMQRRRSALTAEKAGEDRAVDVSVLDRRRRDLDRVLALALEKGIGGHPAVLALGLRRDHIARLVEVGGSGDPGRVGLGVRGRGTWLADIRQRGLSELAAAGVEPGDEVIIDWYRRLGTARELPMTARSEEEAERRTRLARGLLKADGTLRGPAVVIVGREYMAGDRVVVDEHAPENGVVSPGAPGRVERVEHWSSSAWIDLPTDGRMRLAPELPLGKWVRHGYAVEAERREWPDLRTLDLRAAAEAEVVHQPELSLP